MWIQLVVHSISVHQAECSGRLFVVSSSSSFFKFMRLFQWCIISGMVPHKSRRGKLALARLKVFEGVPPPYDKQKRVCVPSAMKILCLRSDRRYCQVGRVASEVGWKYQDVVSSLEAKRKIKARLHYNHKMRLQVRHESSMFKKYSGKIYIIFSCFRVHRKSVSKLHKRSQRELLNKTQSSRSSDFWPQRQR